MQDCNEKPHTTIMICTEMPSKWVLIPELNSSNGSMPFSPGVSASSGTPLLRAALISTLSLSFTSLKLTASVPFPMLGIIGGRVWRSRAHWVVLKKGCVLTSDAPALEPNRRFSSFTSSFLIKDLQILFGG